MSKGALTERYLRIIDNLMISSSVTPVALIEDTKVQEQEINDYIKNIEHQAKYFGDEKVEAKPTRNSNLKRLAQILYEGR